MGASQLIDFLKYYTEKRNELEKKRTKKGEESRQRAETMHKAFRTDKYSWHASRCSCKEVSMQPKNPLHLEGLCISCQFTVQVLKLFVKILVRI